MSSSFIFTPHFKMYYYYTINVNLSIDFLKKICEHFVNYF
nr:MAG TPA: hypothetical protein [Caudoviricetes sp.]